MKVKANHTFFYAGIISFLAFLSFMGCGDKPLFEKSFVIQDGAWTYADSLTFNFNIENLEESYNLGLDVRHLDNYAFRNLYVQIKTKYPDGTFKVQPVSLELADATGMWLGKCSGQKCHMAIPLQVQFRFDQLGDYQMTVHQYMRQSPIMGIDKLALSLKNN